MDKKKVQDDAVMQFLQSHKQTVPDNGFRERVMEKVRMQPTHRLSRSWQMGVWTALCVAGYLLLLWVFPSWLPSLPSLHDSAVLLSSVFSLQRSVGQYLDGVIARGIHDAGVLVLQLIRHPLESVAVVYTALLFFIAGGYEWMKQETK